MHAAFDRWVLHLTALALGAMRCVVILKPPGRNATLPQHAREMAEGTLRAILREAGIDVERFLDA